MCTDIPEVRSRRFALLRSNGHVRVEVGDQGKGIPPEKKAASIRLACPAWESEECARDSASSVGAWRSSLTARAQSSWPSYR